MDIKVDASSLGRRSSIYRELTCLSVTTAIGWQDVRQLSLNAGIVSLVLTGLKLFTFQSLHRGV